MPSANLLRVILSSLLVLVLVASPVHAQVCTGDVILTTQAEVDAFDCTEVTGNLRISGNGITDVDGLSELTAVGGNLHISGNDALENLDGLGNLTEMWGFSLDISDNASLGSIEGISGLTGIFGFVTISNNDALESLEGLGGLFANNVYISDNDALTNLEGFVGISTDVGNVTIAGNDALTSLDGLNDLSVGKNLTIRDNDALTSVEDLAGLTFLFGGLEIADNDALESLEGVAQGSFRCGSDGIGGFLIIADNDALERLQGLTGLTAVGCNTPGSPLIIADNNALEDIDGLSGLTSVGGDVAVVNNEALVNVDGLASLTSIDGGLYVQNNSQLDQCNCGLFDLLTTPGAIGGSVFISDNAEGCNADVEVIEAGPCDASDCTVTTLAESKPYISPDGLGRVDVTFDNPDGLTEVAFTKFDNFALVSGEIDPVPSSIATTDGRPTVAFSEAPERVEMTLHQADASVADAAYFAVASSRCLFADDGLLETDFDPLVQFETRPGSEEPEALTLGGAYPNPARGSVTIHLALPDAADVTLSAYDVMGRRVATLAQTSLSAGIHEVQWDGRSDSGARLASGVYLIRLTTGEQVRTGRLTIVR